MFPLIITCWFCSAAAALIVKANISPISVSLEFRTLEETSFGDCTCRLQGCSAISIWVGFKFVAAQKMPGSGTFTSAIKAISHQSTLFTWSLSVQGRSFRNAFATTCAWLRASMKTSPCSCRPQLDAFLQLQLHLFWSAMDAFLRFQFAILSVFFFFFFFFCRHDTQFILLTEIQVFVSPACDLFVHFWQVQVHNPWRSFLCAHEWYTSLHYGLTIHGGFY